MDKVFLQFYWFQFQRIQFPYSQQHHLHFFSAQNETLLHFFRTLLQIFRFQLRHHVCLIKPILLQLHHRTSLTTLMFITHDPLTFITRDPLTFITRNPRTSITFTTRALYIHDTCSKLTLFYSNILFHSPVFIYLQIQPVSPLTYLSPTFPPLIMQFNRIWHLPAPSKIVMHDAIKLAMAYLFIKLTMQKILVAL